MNNCPRTRCDNLHFQFKGLFVHLASRVATIGVSVFLSYSAYSKEVPKESTASVVAPAAIELSYSLPRDAQVSFLISDSTGHVVRELLHAAPRKQGVNRESWDGLDEAGQPVMAGEYKWKLLATQGLKAEYLLSLGTNPTPRWAKWPGNHNGISAVAVDDAGAYFATGGGEGTPLLVKQTLDGGKRLWDIPTWLDAWSGVVSMEVMNGKLFMFNGGSIRRADAATGKVDPVKWDVLWTGKWDQTSEAQRKMDMAAGSGQLVVSYANRDAIRWFDPVNGKQLDEASVPEPLGVAVSPDGRVLVISKDTVVSLSRAYKKPMTVISGGLKGAYRLAADPRSGEILVAEGSVEGSSRQIKRFSSNGKLLATYGKEGGSSGSGSYDPYSFTQISDITFDREGGFLISESLVPPKRAAHFDRTGNLVKEWYGGQMYACYAAADPTDPTDVWLDSTFGSVIRAKVDYIGRTWTVQEIYTFEGAANGLIGASRHGGERWVPLRHNKQLYLVRGGEVMRVDEEKKQLIPCCVSRSNIYVPWNRDQWGGLPQWFRDLASDPKKTQTSKVPYAFLWIDKNNDGIPQSDEFQFWTKEQVISLNGSGVDSDLNLYGSGKDVDGRFKIFIRPVLNWTKDGVPLYAGLDQAHAVTDRETGTVKKMDNTDEHGKKTDSTDNRGLENITRDEEGNIFHVINTGGDKKFGFNFWAGRVGGNRVTKWDKEGQLQWVVGHHAAGIIPKPGEAGYFWRIVGLTHGCIAVGDVEKTVEVWDKDGLWVGRLLESPDLKVAPDQAYALDTENFGGSLSTNSKTGEVFFYGSTANNSPVFRITGWDQFERQSGTFSIAPEQVQSLQVHVQEEEQRKDVLRIGHLSSLTLDGDLKEWSALQPIEIKSEKEIIARVWAAIDDKTGNLCAAFDVTTKTPWKNSSQAALVFQGGASVSLDLGLWEPERHEAAPGDLRMVAAPSKSDQENQGKVVVFIPKVPAGMKPLDHGQPVYETNNGRQQMEFYNPNGGQFAVKLKPDGSGYTVEFQVPLWRVKFPIQPGSKLRCDVSIGLSNPEGTKTAARIPWHSRDPSDMATEDVYSESVLRPQNWGEARIEK